MTFNPPLPHPAGMLSRLFNLPRKQLCGNAALLFHGVTDVRVATVPHWVVLELLDCVFETGISGKTTLVIKKVTHLAM